jgi:hypothetical protein
MKLLLGRNGVQLDFDDVLNDWRKRLTMMDEYGSDATVYSYSCQRTTITRKRFVESDQDDLLRSKTLWDDVIKLNEEKVIRGVQIG